MLNQILFEKQEGDKLIRVEHTLQKAQIVWDKRLPILNEQSSSILEFVYLLKNQKEQVLNKLIETFSPEKHGQIETLRIMNSYLNSKDVDYLLENSEKFFSQIKELNLATNTTFDNSCHQKLFASNAFSNLMILNLKNNKLLTDSIFNDISNLTTLRELNLNNTGVSDQGLHTLVKSSLFENLHTLIISRNHQIITLEAFTTNDPAKGKQLRHLDLSFTKIIPVGLSNLKKIPFITTLETLDLSDNREMIEDSELEKLYSFQTEDKNPLKFNLKRLYLKNIRLTTPLLNIWLSNDIPQLEYLDLEGNENLFNGLNSEADLKNSVILNHVNTLSIRKTNLSEKSAKILMPHLKSIKNIDMSQNELLTSEALDKIFDILLQNNIKLISLGLANIQLSVQSLKDIFTKYKSITQSVKNLYLRENLELKDEVVNILTETEGLQLSYLNISACNITNDAYIKLISNQSLLSNLEDIRLSENNQIDPDTVLINLVPHLSYLTKLRRVSLGSSFSLDIEIPKELVHSNIQIQPFFCDELD